MNDYENQNHLQINNLNNLNNLNKKNNTQIKNKVDHKIENSLNGEAVFKMWLQFRSEMPDDPLTPEAATPYFHIWNAWIKYLACEYLHEKDKSFYVKNSKFSKILNHSDNLNYSGNLDNLDNFNDLDFLNIVDNNLDYLNNNNDNNNLNKDSKLGLTWDLAKAWHVHYFISEVLEPNRLIHQSSEITKRRYWRVLDRIYDFAQQKGWVFENPAQMMNEEDIPPVENHKGAILNELLWQALPQNFPPANSEYLVHARDRAILLLLYELALAPEEIRGLLMTNWVIQDGQSMLKIEGNRKQQNRTLVVSDEISQAIQKWLKHRATYERAQKVPWLFVSRRAQAVSIRALFHLVAMVLRETAQWCNQPEPARLGPQILRNTAIVRWLRLGVSPELILARTGLKDERGLYHLRDFLRENPLQNWHNDEPPTLLYPSLPRLK